MSGNVRNIAILLLIALVVVVVPGLDVLTSLAWLVLSIVFIVAIAWVLYGFWKRHRSEIAYLSGRRRKLFFGGAAIALLTLVATPFFWREGGVLVLLWLLLLGGSVYAAFRAFGDDGDFY